MPTEEHHRRGRVQNVRAKIQVSTPAISTRFFSKYTLICNRSDSESSAFRVALRGAVCRDTPATCRGRPAEILSTKEGGSSVEGSNLDTAAVYDGTVRIA